MDANAHISGPGYGFHPATEIRRVFFRVAATKGQVFALDLAKDDGDTTSIVPGAVNSAGAGISIWNSAVAPPGTPTQVAHGIFCVAAEDYAIDTWGFAYLKGICSAFVIAASGSVAIGDGLRSDTTSVNSLTSVAQAALVNAKTIGIALVALTTPTVATLTTVYFNGVEGMGSTYLAAS